MPQPPWWQFMRTVILMIFWPCAGGVTGPRFPLLFLGCSGVFAADARMGKNDRKKAARTKPAVYAQLGIVAHGNVLGNGQSQSRAARRSRAAAVHAVEAFSQAGDVLRSVSDAGVLHRIAGRAFRYTAPSGKPGRHRRGA